MNDLRGAESERIEVYRDVISDDQIVVLDKKRKVRLSNHEFQSYADTNFPLLRVFPSRQRRRAWPGYLRSKGIPQWAIDMRGDDA